MRKTAFLISISVVACLLLPNMAMARFGFMGIGGKVGYVKPEDPIDGTFGLGLVLNLGTIVPAVRLEGNVDYWSKSYEASYMGFGGADWTYSDLMVGATAKYMIPTQGTVAPYVGGGLGLHMFSWEYSYEFTYIDPWGDYDETCSESCDDSETDIGFHGVGGIDMTLSPNLRGTLEGRYAIADPDHFGAFFIITYMLAP
jgi:opacity protein-like surface antigen